MSPMRTHQRQILGNPLFRPPHSVAFDIHASRTAFLVLDVLVVHRLCHRRSYCLSGCAQLPSSSCSCTHGYLFCCGVVDLVLKEPGLTPKLSSEGVPPGSVDI